MDRAISASEANRSFSELLRRVEQGETLSVTRHGRVVARIIPSSESDAERRRRVRAMQGVVDSLNGRPEQNLGRVTRDDGYE